LTTTAVGERSELKKCLQDSPDADRTLAWKCATPPFSYPMSKYIAARDELYHSFLILHHNQQPEWKQPGNVPRQPPLISSWFNSKSCWSHSQTFLTSEECVDQGTYFTKAFKSLRWYGSD